MSFRRLHPEQPDSFEFTPENLEWAKKRIALYPEGREASAVIPLLWRAQEQNGGWTTEPMIRYIADMLGMRPIRVLEIATFYTMFQLQPVGRKAHVQVCGTTPCMLRGAEDLVKVCKRRIAEKAHTLSGDGDFSWEEVECLGACTNAPMIQIGEKVYEDLTPERFEEILDEIAAGREPETGPQNGRTSSEPLGGPTTLTDASILERGSDAEALIAAAAAGGGAAGAKAAVAGGYAGGEGKAGKAGGGADGGRPPAGPAARQEVESAEDVQTGRDDAPDAAESAAASGAEGGASSGRAAAVAGVDLEGVEERRLELFTEPPEKADDLKMIAGIGPKIEKILHDLGIYTFAQIASWGPEEIKWVDQRLKFKGRIIREEWVAQADALATGGRDEYVRRFGKEPR